MADVTISIDAQDKAAQVIADLKKQFTGLQTEIDKMQAEAARPSFVDSFKTAYNSVRDAVGQVQMAFQKVKQAYDATVGDFAQYAKDVDIFSNALGSTFDQGSRMIQIADDLGISAQELQTSLFRAVKNGMEPSVAGLAQMAEEYRNIQDPAERADFLQKNFGRSSQELARLLEEGAQGIRDRNAAIEDSLILDEQAIQNARDYEAAVDQLNDTWTATKRNAGEQTIPIVTKFLDITNKSTENIKKGKTAWMNFIPVLNAVHGIYRTVEGAIGAANDKKLREIELAQRVQAETAKTNAAIQHTGDEYEIAAAKTDKWRENMEENNEKAAKAAKKAADEVEKAEKRMAESIKGEAEWEMAYTNAKNFGDRAASEFGLLSSMLKDMGLKGTQVWDGLLIATKKISPAAIEEMVKIQWVMEQVQMKLDEGLSIDVVVNWIMTQSGVSTMGTGDPFARYEAFDNPGGPPAGGNWKYKGTKNGPGTGGAWFNGTSWHFGPAGGNDLTWKTGTPGWMTVPPGYSQDNYSIGLSSGEKYFVQPSSKAAPSSNTTFNIYTNDPVAAAYEVDHLRAVREALQ